MRAESLFRRHQHHQLTLFADIPIPLRRPVERHEKGHKSKFKTKVKWYDKKSKGKGKWYPINARSRRSSDDTLADGKRAD